MCNKYPPFKGLDVRTPTIIPIKGRGLLMRGLRLGMETSCYCHRLGLGVRISGYLGVRVLDVFRSGV